MDTKHFICRRFAIYGSLFTSNTLSWCWVFTYSI